jgi:hypothetical protein
MTIYEDDHDDIVSPTKHLKADMARAAAKGALGSIPLAGSFLVEAADVAMPDPSDDERRRWEGRVSEGVNALRGNVDDLREQVHGPSVTLTGGAAACAIHLIEGCTDGLGHQYVGAQEIASANPEIEMDDVLEGLGELEAYGLIEPLDVIGGGGCHCLTQAGYEVLDLPIMGWDTATDAREIAAWSLRQGSVVEVRAMSDELGWPSRRLNPALTMVLRGIDPGSISREVQPDYVTACFHLDNADRARLRRFASSAG